MIYKVKVCLRCGKEYQPIGGCQKYCKECGHIVELERNRLPQAAWRKENLEWTREYDAKRYEANREKSRIKAAKYREANREKSRESSRKAGPKYRREHREAIALKSAKRRALKYGNTPIDKILTLAQWHEVVETYRHRCLYCGTKAAHLTIDHIIPVSRGGMDSKENVVPACSHCNSSKGAHTPEERFGMGVAS